MKSTRKSRKRYSYLEKLGEALVKAQPITSGNVFGQFKDLAHRLGEIERRFDALDMLLDGVADVTHGGVDRRRPASIFDLYRLVEDGMKETAKQIKEARELARSGAATYAIDEHEREFWTPFRLRPQEGAA